MKKKELAKQREKSIKVLKSALEKKRRTLSETFVKTKAGQEKNIKKVKILKREIAQLLTIVKEKETEEKKVKSKEKKEK